LLPSVTESSRHSAVIIRLRGRSDLGSTLTAILIRYAEALYEVDSKLMIVSDSRRVRSQLAVTGVTDVVGEENLYPSDEWLGRTVRKAHDDALAWVEHDDA
jgi:SulP family sulfate permease